MKMLKKSEITKLASRKGVRPVAVSKFLTGLDPNATEIGALVDLEVTSKSKKWNDATIRAMRDGIRMAYGR
jgi:hypothetical protein